MLQNVYESLRPLPLELSIEEGILFVQNEDEVLTISEKPNEDKFGVSYFTLDREVAERTLRDCPEKIRDWYARLKGLGDVEYSGMQYVAVPLFESSFDLKQTLQVCEYLSKKMIANDAMYKAN